MKWFKHFTDSLEDPFVQILLDQFQHQGYVAWFGLIEIICKENKYNLTGELIISPKYLKRKLRISEKKLKEIYSFCYANDKLLFNPSEKKWYFKFYKILIIKDNYTKNLQAPCKKDSLEEEEDIEG